MAERSLSDLLEIRHTFVNEAAAALAEALVREDAAIAAEISITNTILAEVSAVSEASIDDAALEALAVWLPHARKCQRDARAQRQASEVATAEFRAALAAARTAESTVVKLIENRREEYKLICANRLQSELLENLNY